MRAACAVLIGTLALAGCASNGISVAETMPDGSTFSMEQQTTSTIFTKTQEGAGNVDYSATAADGSGFSLKAGAGVIGQDGGDPTALVLGVINAIAPLMAAQAQAQAAADALRPPLANDARLEEILMLLERLVGPR